MGGLLPHTMLQWWSLVGGILQGGNNFPSPCGALVTNPVPGRASKARTWLGSTCAGVPGIAACPLHTCWVSPQTVQVWEVCSAQAWGGAGPYPSILGLSLLSRAPCVFPRQLYQGQRAALGCAPRPATNPLIFMCVSVSNIYHLNEAFTDKICYRTTRDFITVLKSWEGLLVFARVTLAFLII